MKVKISPLAALDDKGQQISGHSQHQKLLLQVCRIMQKREREVRSAAEGEKLITLLATGC